MRNQVEAAERMGFALGNGSDNQERWTSVEEGAEVLVRFEFRKCPFDGLRTTKSPGTRPVRCGIGGRLTGGAKSFAPRGTIWVPVTDAHLCCGSAGTCARRSPTP